MRVIAPGLSVREISEPSDFTNDRGQRYHSQSMRVEDASRSTFWIKADLTKYRGTMPNPLDVIDAEVDIISKTFQGNTSMTYSLVAWAPTETGEVEA